MCTVYQSANIVQVECPLYYLSLANVIYMWQIYNTTDIKSGCVMHGVWKVVRQLQDRCEMKLVLV